MNTIKKKALEQIDVIITNFQSMKFSVNGSPPFIDSEDYAYLTNAVSSAIDRITDSDSVYREQLEDILSGRERDLYKARGLMGLLKSLRIDVENDFLESFKGILHSELFDDFLDMAEYLLQEVHLSARSASLSLVLTVNSPRLSLMHPGMSAAWAGVK